MDLRSTVLEKFLRKYGRLWVMELSFFSSRMNKHFWSTDNLEIVSSDFFIWHCLKKWYPCDPALGMCLLYNFGAYWPILNRFGMGESHRGGVYSHFMKTRVRYWRERELLSYPYPRKTTKLICGKTTDTLHKLTLETEISSMLLDCESFETQKITRWGLGKFFFSLQLKRASTYFELE